MSHTRRPTLLLVAVALLLLSRGRSPAQLPSDDRLDPLSEQTWRADLRRELAGKKLVPRQVALEWRDAARKAVEVRLAAVVAGTKAGAELDFQDDMRFLLDAELAVAATRPERVAAHERYWELARRNEKAFQVKFDQGIVGPEVFYRIQRGRLEAEYRLALAHAEKE